MAADVSSAPKHDPDAPDVQGDEYDPKYDSDRSGDHNKVENEARGKAKANAENADKADEKVPPGMVLDEISGKPVPSNG
jgi:hypothetical protein